jgi:hypothetical protein
LVAQVLERHPETDWIVAAGDDMMPDPQKSADEIAAECSKHFWEIGAHDAAFKPGNPTWGVMQPIGDVFPGTDRICGSPWMGAEFCKRINGGRGPFWPEYTHMFPDQEMLEVTRKLGILWQRRDLTHFHKWCKRIGETDQWDGNKPTPDFLTEAYSQAHWDKYKALFEARKAAGFPGHKPLVATSA